MKEWKVAQCAIAKMLLIVFACAAFSVFLVEIGGLEIPRSWLPYTGGTSLVIGLFVWPRMYLNLRRACFDAIDRGEPWHYFIPKPKRPARALSLILIASFLAGCATTNPELEQKLATMQAELEAVKAKPPEPATKPQPPVQQTIVELAGVKLPPKCAVIERSDIQVKEPVYAALLWCAEKPPGVQPVVVPQKKAEPEKK